jgi:hypothetical protein
MRRNGELASIDGNDLRPGSRVVHFYYAPEEQARLAAFVSEGLRLGQGVVLAGTPAATAHTCSAVGLPARRRSELDRVTLTRDVGSSLAILVTAVREAAMNFGQARALIDFANVVTPEQIFEVEADLSSTFTGLNLVYITQYDGNAFSAPVALEQFNTHTLAIIGNAFMFENKQHVAPEVYLRRRANKTAAAAAAALVR